MNPFSLNLEYLKKQAKTRLKAIKAGSNTEFEWLLKYHLSNSLNKENVKLADTQLAIARELGVSSWNKIKLHVEQLERNKESSTTLDGNLRTLHVRCGHDIQQALKESGFTGDFLPYVDPFCIGPLAEDEEELLTLRSEFIYHHLITEMKDVDKNIEQIKKEGIQDTLKLKSTQYQRIVLWVEHDNYDQLMLLRVLSLLSCHNHTRIELIETDRFPGHVRFIGLGQLPPEALRVLWDTRKKVTIEQIATAKTLWSAFCSSTPTKLIEIYNSIDMTMYPNIKKVIFRHLQELPNSTSKLGLTQSLTVQVLKKNSLPSSFHDLFKQYLSIEPLVYLGDLMYWAILKPLTENQNSLLISEDLKKHGWKNISIELRNTNIESLQSIENKWIGGIRISEDHYWTWDHKDLSTMSEIQNSPH